MTFNVAHMSVYIHLMTQVRRNQYFICTKKLHEEGNTEGHSQTYLKVFILCKLKSTDSTQH